MNIAQDACVPLTPVSPAIRPAIGTVTISAAPVLAFATMVGLVAGNVVGVRIVSRELPLFWGAGTRFAVAGVIFGLFALARRQPLPRGRALLAALIFGALQFSVGLALGYWAMQRVSAGLASMILATVPLFTLLFAAAARLESLHLRGLAGALIAMVGIAVLFGARGATGVPILRLVAAVGSAACIALTAILLKSFPQVAPASMNAVGMLTGAALLLMLSVLTGETLQGAAALIPSSPVAWWAQLYLILPGSIGVFGLFLYLLRRWKASTVSYQNVLSPPVTIVLSLWLLSEPLSANLALGGALILAGVYLGALHRARPPD
ncbi:MAG: EamA family transporter [Anaerolineae bacterium]